MDIVTARQIAARIWCDEEMAGVALDSTLAEQIAQLLANRYDADNQANDEADAVEFELWRQRQ